MVAPSTILRIAEQVRREQLDGNDRAAFWSVGTCRFISAVLAERLLAAGLKAVRVGGFYTTGEQASSPDRPVARWDGAWIHWWVECEGFVVDVAADRVNATSPSAPGIVIVPKASASCYRERLPALEHHHGGLPTFEQ